MSTRVARACFGVWMVVLAAGYYAVPAYGSALWAALGFSASIAVLAGVLLNRPAHALPWFLLCGVLVTFTLGDAIYNLIVDGNPFPSPADAFYLLSYPLLAGALLLFIRFRSGADDRAALLDALVPTAAIALLVWVLWIGPFVRDADLSTVQKLISIGYPLGDVLALAMLVRLLGSPGTRHLSITALTLGVTSLLGTDLIYGLNQLNQDWHTGSPVDLGWVVFYTMLGYAALDPSMTRLTEHTPAPFVPRVAGWRRLAILCAAALVAPAVLVYENLDGTVSDAPVIAVFSALMFLLVIGRLAGLLADHRQISNRERVLREAGAQLVSAATPAQVADAVRAALAQLMPPDEPYVLESAGIFDSMTRDEFFADGVTLQPVDVLPPTHGEPLDGFTVALRAPGPLLPPAGSSALQFTWICLAAREPVLWRLQPAFEALVSQGTMAIDRIALGAEINRRKHESYFRTLIQNASDVILIVDDEDRIGYASPSAADVFGTPAATLTGTPVTDLIVGEQHENLRDALRRLRAGRGQATAFDLVGLGADGRTVQVECTIQDMRDEPTVRGAVLTMRDVTERRRLESDLAHQAFHDTLTGLANRLLLQNRMEHALMLAQRDRSVVGLLFIDIDDFKVVNDTLGLVVGDRLLAAVGARIAGVVGPQETVARMGGDEFAVLIEQSYGPAEADDVAARIVEACAEPFELRYDSGGSAMVGGAVSIGVTTSVEAHDAAEMQRQADLALHVSKGAGKGRYARYQADLHTAMVERLEMRAALSTAVEDQQLVLQYQPIVDLATEEIVGLEALVRWQHPTRGLIGPGEFIEVAEENGAIVPIGAWVLREALLAIANWRQLVPAAPLRYVSVNVSARQFRSPGFVDEVAKVITESGVAPWRLLLEITESLLLRDDESVWQDLARLREMGVRIAIDDFGTGYSSLSYLRQMPVDILKIDKSFIDDISSSKQQRALVAAIVSIADNLNLGVVAEGVEDPAHKQILLDMGCPFGQGYLFSPPAWPDAVAAWLDTGIREQIPA
ncbi:diguanylate cyclase (GGDEF)-like protein/PAS domain S-box-containing protein [Catenuloplanes nepalensis]|uniref:Diguanylate cyclase (GGDEF)-like protein/PAS domain S-box-containing protein n=1 Tax=Catenuloplanes nepalensis TaxID=587533 RepID=A0ABT9N683_9ACTN|nr:EAL domain-containing protein [Catenuloplanes nepalensis]MDP9799038.1 diguanylate cyclase (GGDEF)-like protein/PAS domain S-box-containing protein [Catenuloplanes nepalensis]